MFTFMDAQNPFAQLGANPISADQPGGINAKYEAEFEQLEAELAKQESINAERVDWQLVVNLSANILTNTSKDFVAASYLAHGLTLNQGLNGLLHGLQVLQGLTENFWKEGFPAVKRLRARKSALEWLSEKTQQYLQEHDADINQNQVKQNPQLIKSLASAVKVLDADLAERMGDSAPAWHELNRSFKHLKQAADFELQQAQQAAQPAPAPAPTTPAPAAVAEAAVTAPQPAAIQQQASQQAPVAEPVVAPAAQPAPAPVAPAPAPAPAATATESSEPLATGSIANDNEAKKRLRALQQAQRQLAAFYGQQKNTDPKRYRFSRQALWGSIDQLPPLDAQGNTRVAPPAAAKLASLQQLFDQQKYLEVIEQAEAIAAKQPYWFDGQHLIAQSLEQLGNDFSAAHQALSAELSALIARVSDIVDCRYSDGSPFCNEATSEWLAALNSAPSASQKKPAKKAVAKKSANNSANTSAQISNSSIGSNNNSQVLDDLTEQVKALSSSDDFDQAFALLRAHPAANMRERFYLRLLSAQVLAQQSDIQTAVDTMEKMVTELPNIAAADWDADFNRRANELLQTLYSQCDEEDVEHLAEKQRALAAELIWLLPNS